MGLGRLGVRFPEVRREWRLANLFWAEYLVPCVEICERRGLKVNADKSNVIVLEMEEGSAPVQCIRKME